MNSSMVIRPVCQDDYEPLASLYGYYALNTVYTYYSKAPTPEYMERLFTGKEMCIRDSAWWCRHAGANTVHQ